MALLPPAHESFQGRQTELKRLLSTFDCENINSAVINGIGGMGKTALALQVMHHPTMRDRFGDRRFLIDFRSRSCPLQAIDEAIDAFPPPFRLGWGRNRVDEIFYRIASGPPTLLCLDAFEHLEELARSEAFHLVICLLSARNVALLLTTRLWMGGMVTRHVKTLVNLQGLTLTTAKSWLLNSIDKDVIVQQSVDGCNLDAVVRALSKMVDGHPLSMRHLVAALRACQSLGDGMNVLYALKKKGVLWLSSDCSDEPDVDSLVHCLDSTFHSRLLDDYARQTLSELAHRSDNGVFTVQDLLLDLGSTDDLRGRQLRSSLDRLFQSGLLCARNNANEYWLAPIVKLYARSKRLPYSPTSSVV